MIARAQARTEAPENRIETAPEPDDEVTRPALGIMVAVAASVLVWPVLIGLWLLLSQ